MIEKKIIDNTNQKKVVKMNLLKDTLLLIGNI